jgi:tetratricopeptide (TPR) repeat protein
MSDTTLPLLEQLQSNLDDRKNPLAKEIYAILAQLEPQVAVASAILSIPRRFNVRMLASMLQAPVPEASDLFETVRFLPIVSKRQASHYEYRPGVREILIAEMRALDSELYLDLHRRAYHFYASSSPLALKDKEAMATISAAEGDWLREQLYHLLVINPAKGFELYDTLFITGYQRHLEGDSTFLKAFGWQPSSVLYSMGDLLQLEYYESLPAFVPHHVELSIQVISAFIRDDVPDELRGWALARLGILHTEVGDYSAAIDLLDKSLRIWQRSDNKWYEALLHGCLGNAYLGQGDLGKAKRWLRKGVALLEQSEHLTELAILHNNLGNVFSREEDWNRAFDAYQKSLAMKRQLGDLFGTATSTINLGTVCHRRAQDLIDPGAAKSQFDQAYEYYGEGIALYRQLGLQTLLAKPLYKMAVLHYQLGNMSQARACLKEAIPIIEAFRVPDMNDAYYLAERVGLEDL